MSERLIKKSQIFQLVVLIVVLPLLAESIYAPGLPALAESFSVSDGIAEATLSIYLFGMSVGVLFWGNLSDIVGRKPVLLSGFILFLIATIGCYFSGNIYMFLLLRFAQAFGGAVSCVTQSINRDVFDQKERMALSSRIGTAVSVAPAVGAMLGGLIVQYSQWRESFLLLMFVACFTLSCLHIALPETKQGSYLSLSPRAFYKATMSVLKDNNLVLNGMIIGLGLGILYAFMSEGSFYCINNLKWSSQAYGAVCASGSIAYAMGCRLSDQMIQLGVSFQRVMKLGTIVMLISYVVLLLLLFHHSTSAQVRLDSAHLDIAFSVLWTLSCLGLSFVLTPCFANALENQRENAGVAASALAFTYNIISATVNLTITYLHSNERMRMPMIFLVIVLIIAVACDILYRNQAKRPVIADIIAP